MSEESTENLAKRAADEIKVTSYLDYREYLLAVYQWLKTNQPRYSYLQFAVDLGFSKSNVIHLVVVGKRPLTSKAALRVSDSLGLTGTARRYFDLLVRYNNCRKAPERDKLFEELLQMKNRTLKSSLEQSQLEFFNQWFNPVIREMMLMPDFESDPYWIADQIHPRIRPEQARKCLELLAKLGLAAHDEAAGTYKLTSTQVTTGDEVASFAVARYHQQMIDLGKEAITTVSELERDVSAITVCVSPETAEAMKREIQAFRKRLLAMAEASNTYERIYQLNMQFFPVTGRK